MRWRHTFAPTPSARGVDLHSLARLIGHASVATTERYLHLNTGDLPPPSARLPATEPLTPDLTPGRSEPLWGCREPLHTTGERRAPTGQPPLAGQRPLACGDATTRHWQPALPRARNKKTSSSYPSSPGATTVVRRTYSRERLRPGQPRNRT